MRESEIWRQINQEIPVPENLVCYCGYDLICHIRAEQVEECFNRRTNPKNILNQLVEVVTTMNPIVIHKLVPLDQMLKSWKVMNRRAKLFYKLRGF